VAANPALAAEVLPFRHTSLSLRVAAGPCCRLQLEQHSVSGGRCGR
jgi:hypothetical protein